MRWGDPVRRKGTTLRSSRGHCTSASAVQQSRDRSASSLRGMLASVVLRPVLNKRDPRSFTLDSNLEGSPSVPKSGKKWQFFSKIPAFVH